MSEFFTSFKFWRRTAILCAVLCALLALVIGFMLYMARQPSNDHKNLYYVMWKLGLRDYASNIALPGMVHDQSFRESLRGISVDEFQELFPATFYEMEWSPRPDTPQKRTYWVDDYQAATSSGHLYGIHWVAIFEGGKLVALEFDKGI